MNHETPHRKYLTLADCAVGLSGKDVVEIGGCTPPSLASDFGAKSWRCVDLNKSAVESYNNEAHAMSVAKYNAIYMDAAKAALPNSSADLVYSINAFEHIGDIEGTLASSYRVLRDGGFLFTLFGPIWNSDVGHHLSIAAEDGSDLNFNAGVLQPWEHLVSDRHALHDRLSLQYGKVTAARAVEYIYDYHDLNRLSERDYFRFVGNSLFSSVFSVRRKVAMRAPVSGATRTRELLFVLKKGVASPMDSLRVVWGLGVAAWKLRFPHVRS